MKNMIVTPFVRLDNHDILRKSLGRASFQRLPSSLACLMFMFQLEGEC